ncbi:MAG: phosphoribosylanthranilate isomerase [Gemmatimonadaceae bacterium]|nr:phosphoribosylanthranilate isomerase [Gemmatimonadaceae bacterium]
MTTAMKFCGITRATDAGFAAELGAAYVGSIFTDSPRRVSPADAADIWTAAPGLGKVGVFGDAPVDEILEAAGASGLDVIQLHCGAGSGVIERLRTGFRGEIWSVIRIGKAGALAVAGESADADAVLVDSYSESGLGGTGRTFDWEREAAAIRRLVGDKRLIVAGGLDPDNVASAIRALAPDVVDVSSGVESSPGVKDHFRMRAFAAAVAQADAE